MRRRQHVNPLGTYFDTFRGSHPRLVPGRPIELEIGCAEAQFLFERARREPERTYIGLEIREPLVRMVTRQASVEALPVQAILCNANAHLASLFPPGSVERVYLNFPDPWFKRRHHRRRLIDPQLGAAISRVLAPGGELFVQSDVWEIALGAMEVFDSAESWFENQAGPWSFWKQGNPYGVRSWREVRCEQECLPIWRIWYRRRGISEA